MADEPSTSKEQRVYIHKSILFRTTFKADFPEEGVINRAGYLFHHFLPFQLRDEHIIRLENFGIKYKKYVPFSREEDDVIRENWRKFAEEHDFRYEDARIYVGFVGNIHAYEIDDIIRTKKENDLLVELAMWPELCRNLENRSARQVQARICEIFDPYYIGRADPIPLEIAMESYMRYKEGESMVDLAIEYGYPFRKLRHAINNAKRDADYQGITMEDVANDPKVLDTLKMPRRYYTRFYSEVLKRAHINEGFIRDTITTKRKGWKKAIKEEMEDFNWTKLLPRFKRQNEISIRKEWFNLLKEIHKMYYNELEANFLGNDDNASETAKDEAWGVALRQILPPSIKSLPVLKLYCHALYRSVTETSVNLLWADVAVHKLRQKLMKYQIINQSDYNIKECECYNTIATLLRSWNKNFFRFISFAFRTRDKLKIAERCFERLIDTHGEYPEMERIPSITRTVLVESTILELRKLTKGEWRPPKFMRQYIRNSAFIPFFSNAPGSEIYCEEDELRRVRKNIFSDKGSIQVLDIKQFGRAAMKSWRSTKPAQQPEEEPIVEEEPPRGWNPAINGRRKLSRKRHFNYVPPETPARQPLLFETIVESPAPLEELEEPVETAENFEDDSVLAGLQLSQPAIPTPVKKARKNSSDELLSPILKKKPAEEDEFSGFESEAPEDEESDGFSQLRLAEIKPKKKKQETVSGDMSWSNIFG